MAKSSEASNDRDVDGARILQRTFKDFESFSRMTGWELDFRQLGAAQLSIPVRALSIGAVTVTNIGINCSYHQRGMPPAGRLTFGLPHCGIRNWFHRPAQHAGLMNFNHPSGFDCVSGPGFSATTLSLDFDFVVSTTDALKLPLPEDFASAASNACYGRSQASQRLANLLRTLLFRRELLTEEGIGEGLVELLIDIALPDRSEHDPDSGNPRSRVVTMAVDYLQDHAHEPVRVRDVCESTGISIRTLDRAFKEHFGISPKSYIQQRRLSGVRSDLVSMGADSRISDVANKWGFWHMGQFARDYRKLFGELPSTTIGNPVYPR